MPLLALLVPLHFFVQCDSQCCIFANHSYYTVFFVWLFFFSSIQFCAIHSKNLFSEYDLCTFLLPFCYLFVYIHIYIYIYTNCVTVNLIFLICDKRICYLWKYKSNASRDFPSSAAVSQLPCSPSLLFNLPHCCTLLLDTLSIDRKSPRHNTCSIHSVLSASGPVWISRFGFSQIVSF